jgi:hypothetical protein
MQRINIVNRIIVLFYVGLLLFIIWKVPKEKNTKLERSEKTNTLNEKGDHF